jgi:hypothetical protein
MICQIKVRSWQLTIYINLPISFDKTRHMFTANFQDTHILIQISHFLFYFIIS